MGVLDQCWVRWQWLSLVLTAGRPRRRPGLRRPHDQHSQGTCRQASAHRVQPQWCPRYACSRGKGCLLHSQNFHHVLWFYEGCLKWHVCMTWWEASEIPSHTVRRWRPAMPVSSPHCLDWGVVTPPLLPILAFFWDEPHRAIIISKGRKQCHCWDGMRKWLLRAGSWLDNIKISLSPFQPHVCDVGFSLVSPHFRLNKQTSAEMMNGTGEEGPL